MRPHHALLDQTSSAPTVEEVTNLLRRASVENPENSRNFHIAATTGARRGEICALRWSDLDTPKGSLTIRHSLMDLPGGPTIKDTKTHVNRRMGPGSRDLAGI